MNELPDHLKRVIEERDQLSERLAKLRVFLDSTAFKQVEGTERTRLYRQEMYMSDYLRVLNERLGAATQ